MKLRHITAHGASPCFLPRLATLTVSALALSAASLLPLLAAPPEEDEPERKSDSRSSTEKQETREGSGNGGSDSAAASPSEEIIIPLYLVKDARGSAPATPGSGPLPIPTSIPQGSAQYFGSLIDSSALSTESLDYIVGPQDLLEVTVLNAESLNRMVRVSSDGSITLPLVGEMMAAGLGKKELERQLAVKLGKEFVRDAQVSVFVREAVSKRVSIIGAVRSPGSYELVGRKTLLEILSQAGGVVPDLGVDRIVILRRTKRGNLSIPVDLDALVVRADPRADVELIPGDIINVPVENFIEIYVNGAVRRADVYKIKISEPVTLLQVITMAGGVLPGGSERRVQLMRRTGDGGTEIIPVNLKKVRKGEIPDPRLRKDDVIIVPEARF